MIRTGKGNPGRRWIRWAAGGCLTLVGLAGLVLVAVTSRPGWYQPATVGPEDYPLIRNEIPTFGGAIGTYLERGQPFRITLQDDQVNRWIAARGEIWPGLGDALPRELADPVVSFQPGRIVLGVRYNSPTFSSVLSLAVNLEMDAARGAVLVKVDRLRAGHLPVPRMLVDDQARKALDREAGRHVNAMLRRIWSQAAEYVPVDASAKGPPTQEIPLAAMLGDIWEFRLARQEPLAKRRVRVHHFGRADRAGQVVDRRGAGAAGWREGDAGQRRSDGAGGWGCRIAGLMGTTTTAERIPSLTLRARQQLRQQQQPRMNTDIHG